MKRLVILMLSGLTAIAVQAAEVKLTFVGASDAALENPHDLKLSPNGEYLFVSDVGNNRVAILDPQSLDLIAEFGSDHQSGTHDVDFDSRGRAYVADTHNNRVTIYDMNGTSARLVGELSERVRGPEGVLVHPNGLIYVAGAWSGNVVAYREGKVVGELDGLSSPHDLELAENGDIWLADAGNSRILLLSPDLGIRRELGRREYDFNGVRYMDLTPEGMLIAADKNNHVVKFIGADGRLMHVLGDGKPGQGVNKFTTPEGVEVRGSELWLSDSGNDRVVKYSLEVE
ncbi:MAG: NHL repeat-containing protein [Gammaproteobacteria bacterium]|nr:NHL repeat-containing protein [Gammaproteobacteria bacterium]MDH3448149.1 NHL repeat-containing protein [Gammaproteobacteria bacterium]